MPTRIPRDDYDLIIRFGGGLHTRAAEIDIHEREAAGGNNFLLDLENRELRPRPPFDLVGTVPNAGAIRGGGSLLKSDGTVAAFFQGSDTVYDWDGNDFQASPILDTVSTSARLRGHWRTHGWTLDDKLIVTDLALAEVVKEWDGDAAFVDTTFLTGTSTAFGSFKAKYCNVSNERAMFANIEDGSSTKFPHMIVGSTRGEFEQISVSDRPSSSLNEEDPFFLLAPDLRPINALVEAFGTVLISTEQGRLFSLSGESAKDFTFKDFYAGSGASGNESVTYTGNDVIYGRKGRLESVTDTDRFGDSEADDITRRVADAIRSYTGWTTVYNSRVNRVYSFPSGQSEVWVFDTIMRGGEVSEWMRWVTQHSLAFQPTFVASMLDPSDTLEYVFMGDSMGNVYRLEGTGTDGDGGANAIVTEFLTKLNTIETPPDQEIFNLTGYIRYRKNAAFTVELIFENAGINIFNETVTLEVPAAEGGSFYGGEAYYGGDFYYGSISGRLSRQRFAVPGQGSEFQVRVKVTETDDWAISEIGLRLEAAGT